MWSLRFFIFRFLTGYLYNRIFYNRCYLISNKIAHCNKKLSASKMFSRAHLLIQKEIEEVNCESDLSINQLMPNSVFEQIAIIEGPNGTSWEGGVFQVYMKFSENYNLIPPSVNFQTIPYHPNIDISTGKPSLDILDDLSKWKSEYTIKHILKSLQHLLVFPFLDRAVNMDAVFMHKGNPVQYENIAKQAVIATQRIKQILKDSLAANSLDNIACLIKDQNSRSESKMSEKKSTNCTQCDSLNKYPLFSMKSNEKHIRNEKCQQAKKYSFARNVSFEDYCTLWKGIATTKSDATDNNEYVKSNLFKNPVLIPQHMSISVKELEDEVYKQLNDHKHVMYGKFDFSNRKNNNQVINLNKTNVFKENMFRTDDISKEKKQAHKENLERAESFFEMKRKTKLDQNDVIFEQEVDDLINWTQNI